MTSAWTTVLYPQGAKFDKDYYKNKHMGIVEENWKKYGLKSWKIVYFGDDSPYCVQALLEWENIGKFQEAASSAEAKTVLGDVQNFCDKEPTIIAGEVAFSG